MAQARTIRILFETGSARGLRYAIATAWSGRAFAFPMDALADFRKRPEALRPAAYLLLGEDPAEAGRVRVYIGEAEAVGERMAQHAKDDRKGWAEEAVVLTESGEMLSKAHVRYLERALWALARRAPRLVVEYAAEPPGSSLSEMDRAELEAYLEGVRFVLPALSPQASYLFESAQAALEAPAPGGPAGTHGAEDFHLASRTLEARMRRTPEGFVVLQGSMATPEASRSLNPGYLAERERLAARGVLVPSKDGKTLTLQEDVLFRVPSAAAAVLTGAPSNGRLAWRRTRDGLTLAEVLEQEQGTGEEG